MDERSNLMTFGLPRTHKEPGERRDFLPPLAGVIADSGAEVFIEHGLGEGMGYCDEDYLRRSPRIHVTDLEGAYAQDAVLVLRAPVDHLQRLRRGATLISMLHYPTRPARVELLRDLGLEAISLDSIVDDAGRRMVENGRAVAWNGLEAAFDVLSGTHPYFLEPGREPIRVTVMGAGAIGRDAVEAATKYGSISRAEAYLAAGFIGVEVTTVGRNLTCSEDYMRRRLALTDILVDASQRSNPSVPLVRNEWIAAMPRHAVLCDLVVDPYLLAEHPPTVRGIEGIPQGDLDHWAFPPDDPAWEEQVPKEIPSSNRRSVVSCYSWPGVHPEPCMEAYGLQLAPLLQVLVRRDGIDGLRPDGGYHERALWRASLRSWIAESDLVVVP